MDRFEIALTDLEHIDGMAFKTYYVGTLKGAIKHAWSWFNKINKHSSVFQPMIGQWEYNELDEPVRINWKYL